MIAITRLLARQAWAMFRRAGIGKRPISRAGCRILIQAGPHGLTFRAQATGVAVEHHQPGDLASARAVLPLEFLERCQGSKREPVTIEIDRDGNATARWIDGIPQAVQYADVGQEFSGFPPAPATLAENGPELLRALADATTVADPAPTRFALSHLQLTGEGGRIVGTDGRQILSQRGFRFPWAGEVLLPAANVLRSKELPQSQIVLIGEIENWTALRTGSWTFWFAKPSEGRFPKVDAYDRAPAFSPGRLKLTPADAKFLLTALPRLPESDNFNDPLTLDLGSPLLLRARGAGQTRCTELLLSNSTYEGESILLNSNRKFLLRALELGFHEWCVTGAESPIVATEASRTYVWALLDAKSALRPGSDPIRFESVVHGAAPSQNLNPQSIESPMTTKRTPAQSSVVSEAQATPTVAARTHERATTPLEHAVELRATLRAAAAQTSDLIAALKQQRRKSRLVETTLATLREPKTAEAA